ncbi:MAG: hypothetical protein D3906_12980 [Candidatus Electrothrix sp. AUS1_2]|nr:hypothetical protein [Candidatus Electrothrix sp. AUS1_2]
MPGLRRRVECLPADSPTVDLDTGCGTGLNEDQRGKPRPVGNGCDAGSVEFRRKSAAMSWLYLLLKR